MSCSAALAAAKNGSPKPSATEPPTATSSRSSRLATEPSPCAEQPAGPLRPPRATPARPGPPVRRAIAVPLISASRQPRARAAADARRPARRSTWPTWPALPCGAVEQPAVDDDARRRHRSRRPSRGSCATPAPAPLQPSPTRQRLGVAVDDDRQAEVVATARCSSGKSRQPGMFSGETRDAAGRHRAGAADAHRQRALGLDPATPRTSAPRRPASASAARGVGSDAERSSGRRRRPPRQRSSCRRRRWRGRCRCSAASTRASPSCSLQAGHTGYFSGSRPGSHSLPHSALDRDAVDGAAEDVLLAHVVAEPRRRRRRRAAGRRPGGCRARSCDTVRAQAAVRPPDDSRLSR